MPKPRGPSWPAAQVRRWTRRSTFPGLKEGLEGVAFVDACVRSSARNGAWVKLAI
jgi:hypothetical protein